MDEFEIRGINDRAVIVFGPRYSNSCQIQVRNSFLTVECIIPHVSEPSFHTHVGDYLEKMAGQWTGWDGELSWAPPEEAYFYDVPCDELNHLSLTAVHNGVGRVQMQVVLQGRDVEWRPWRVETWLDLEPGQLEQLARRAKRFFENDNN